MLSEKWMLANANHRPKPEDQLTHEQPSHKDQSTENNTLLPTAHRKLSNDAQVERESLAQLWINQGFSSLLTGLQFSTESYYKLKVALLQPSWMSQFVSKFAFGLPTRLQSPHHKGSPCTGRGAAGK